MAAYRATEPVFYFINAGLWRPEWITANKVSAYVNNVKNQGPDSIKPEVDD